MTAEALLSTLRKHGVVLAAEGDQLRIEAPRGLLTPDMREVLIEHKASLLALLSRSDRQRGRVEFSASVSSLNPQAEGRGPNRRVEVSIPPNSAATLQRSPQAARVTAECPSGHTAEALRHVEVVGWVCEACQKVYDTAECRVHLGSSEHSDECEV